MATDNRRSLRIHQLFSNVPVIAFSQPILGKIFHPVHYLIPDFIGLEVSTEQYPKHSSFNRHHLVESIWFLRCLAASLSARQLRVWPMNLHLFSFRMMSVVSPSVASDTMTLICHSLKGMLFGCATFHNCDSWVSTYKRGWNEQRW